MAATPGVLNTKPWILPSLEQPQPAKMPEPPKGYANHLDFWLDQELKLVATQTTYDALKAECYTLLSDDACDATKMVRWALKILVASANAGSVIRRFLQGMKGPQQ